MDTRITKLAKLLTSYSCALQPGDKVLIEFTGMSCRPLIEEIIDQAYALGAVPYVNISDPRISRRLLMQAGEEQLAFKNEVDMMQMKGMEKGMGIQWKDDRIGKTYQLVLMEMDDDDEKRWREGVDCSRLEI